MDCGHRDRGGRRWSLCLKNADSVLEGLKDCDGLRMELCKDRDDRPGAHEDREELIRMFREPCPDCGGRHRNLRGRVVCNYLRAAGSIIDGGSSEMPPVSPNIRESAWPKIRTMVLDRDGHTCVECDSDLSSRPGWLVEVHHVVPRSMGGDDDPRNLKTLCTQCHRPRTEILQDSIYPTTEDERNERELRRKFRDGRDMLIVLCNHHS